MWAITTIGFFSVVLDDEGEGLQVRARVRSDLDALRDEFMPTLGPVVELGAHRDYKYRAYISKEDFAEGMKRMALAIDYGNFKSAVGKRQGYERSHLYGKVWGVLHGLSMYDSVRKAVRTVRKAIE